MSSNENEDFEPLVVLQLAPTTPAATKEWIIKRLTASHTDDEGACLLARFEPDPENQNNIIVVGATLHRLLVGAEELRIQKKLKNNRGLAEFLVSDIDQFENSENPEDVLFKSEKQRIIWEEIQNLRPTKNERSVPGVQTKSGTIAENDTILNVLRHLDLLLNAFPLHDKEDIKLIEHNWFKSKASIFKSQDIHKVRYYFGENVAFYFAFLEFYTKALIPTAILGIVLSFSDTSNFFKYSVFCVFNVLWWTVFMERWKRLTNNLAYQWGTLDLQVYERPRALYHGNLHLSPITNKLERRYSPWKRTLKKYIISYPLIMGCLAFALAFYFNYFRVQKYVNGLFPLDKSVSIIPSKVARLVPSISYSVLLIPVKLLYKKLATFLNDFENHRLQTTYENELTSKLFVFYFVNCFVGLFYQAFFEVNYENVVTLLTSLAIINAVIMKFTEQLLPYIIKLVKKNQLVKQEIKASNVIKQTKTLTPFEGTYGDYLTIFEQYGYVALFSAVFPWVTICALINNIFELRADAFKYCYVYQRPFAQQASSIGSWHYAFDILSSIAIVTNTALIAMQPSVREYFSEYSDVEYILIFIAAEHILLAVKFAIDFAIPDVPYEVEIARAKSVYESDQALRRERERKAAKIQTTITKQ